MARCLNNELEDNQETQSELDFERMSCTDDNDFEEYMDDEALPLEVRRLTNQEKNRYCLICMRNDAFYSLICKFLLILIL